jgi:REP element-mobilizing transposase RayT
MSEKYKMPEDDKAYFMTLTVTDWVDVFARKRYKLQLVESLKYCQQMKGLEIYAWCLMSNHMHLIAKATGRQLLWEVIRDLKKFTAKTICAEMIKSDESGNKI